MELRREALLALRHPWIATPYLGEPSSTGRQFTFTTLKQSWAIILPAGRPGMVIGHC
jgi:hypothetical protein